MKRFLLPIFVISVGLLVGSAVLALSKDDIVFPVAELNNCASKQECKAFCDNPDNMEQCVAFAKKYNLMRQSEIEKSEKFIRAGKTGPGGCQGQSQCETYCSNIDHIEECVAFAEKHGMMNDNELQNAKKIRQFLSQGGQTPGGCKSKEQCEQYCQNPSNMEQCINFAEQAGFMDEKEKQEARKVLAYLKGGGQPLPCIAKGGKDACEAYCSDHRNFGQCIKFAKGAGLMSDRELRDAEKMLKALEKGVKPPNCRGEEECRVYCDQEEHFSECTEFAIAAGFVSPQEAELIRKTGGKGPGGCRGEEECRAFCENPSNQEVCFNFASRYDLIPEEDLAQMKEGMGRLREGLDQSPPEVRECLQNNLGVDLITKLESGTLSMGPHMQKMGERMKHCFEQFMPRPEEFGEHGDFPKGAVPPEGFDKSIVPEQKDCVKRILAEAGIQGPPTPEIEGRIRTECFGAPGQSNGSPIPAPGDYRKPPEHFKEVPEEFKEQYPDGVLEEFKQQFEEQYPNGVLEEFKQQFEEQYQQQYEEQYQQQYEEQYRQQFEQQYQQQQQPPPPPPQPPPPGETGLLRWLLKQAGALLMYPLTGQLR